jgi:hypothetical protein
MGYLDQLNSKIPHANTNQMYRRASTPTSFQAPQELLRGVTAHLQGNPEAGAYINVSGNTITTWLETADGPSLAPEAIATDFDESVRDHQLNAMTQGGVKKLMYIPVAMKLGA